MVFDRNLQAWLHEFHCSRCPSTSDQPFEQFHESGTITFHGADDDHYYISVWIEFSSVCYSIVDFLRSVDFFHCRCDYFHRKELSYFVSDVEWTVKYKIPGTNEMFLNCDELKFSFLFISLEHTMLMCLL